MLNNNERINKYGFRKNKAVKGLGVALLGTFIFGTSVVSADEVSENTVNLVGSPTTDLVDTSSETVSEASEDVSSESVDEVQPVETTLPSNEEVTSKPEIPSMIADRSDEGSPLVSGTGFRARTEDVSMSLTVKNDDDLIQEKDKTIETELIVEARGTDKIVDGLSLKIKVDRPEGISMDALVAAPNNVEKTAENRWQKEYTYSLPRLVSGTRLVLPITTKAKLNDFYATNIKTWMSTEDFSYTIKAGIYDGNTLLSEKIVTINNKISPLPPATLEVDDSAFGKKGEAYIQGYRSPKGDVTTRGAVDYVLSQKGLESPHHPIYPVFYVIDYDKENFELLPKYGVSKKDEGSFAIRVQPSDNTRFSLVYKGSAATIPDTNIRLVPTIYPSTDAKKPDGSPLETSKVYPNGTVLTLNHRNAWSDTTLPSGTIGLAHTINFSKNLGATIGNHGVSTSATSKLTLVDYTGEPDIMLAQEVRTQSRGLVNVQNIEVDIPKEEDNVKLSKLAFVSVDKENIDVSYKLYGVTSSGSKELLSNVSKETPVNVSKFDKFLFEFDNEYVTNSSNLKLKLGYIDKYNNDTTPKADYADNVKRNVITDVDAIKANSFVAKARINGNTVDNYYSNYTALIKGVSHINVADKKVENITMSDKVYLTVGSFIKYSYGTETVNKDTDLYHLLIPKDVDVKVSNDGIWKLGDRVSFNDQYDSIKLSFTDKIGTKTITELNKYLTENRHTYASVALSMRPSLASRVTPTSNIVSVDAYVVYSTDNPNLRGTNEDYLDFDKDGLTSEETSNKVPSPISKDDVRGKETGMGKTTINVSVPKSLYIYDNSSKTATEAGYSFDTTGVMAGDTAYIRPILLNGDSVDYRGISVVTVLSSQGDKVFEGNKERGSQFTPTLKEGSVVVPKGFSVLYSTDSQNGNAAAITNWVSNVTDWSAVKAIKWVSDSNYSLSAGNQVNFGYAVNTPRGAKDGSKIVTTTAVSVNNQANAFLEGYRSTVSVLNPVKYGSVTVDYFSTDGTAIKPELPVVSNVEVGSKYNTNTTEFKPETIEYDGKIYYFKEHKATSHAIAGDVTEAPKTVTYIYELPTDRVSYEKGKVIVHYVDDSGTPVTIKADVENTPLTNVTKKTEKVLSNNRVVNTVNEDLNVNWSLTPANKPNTISHGGYTYTFKAVKAGDKVSGKLVAGTTEVTLVYTKLVTTETTENKGNVFTKHVTADGVELRPLTKQMSDVVVSRTVTTTTGGVPNSVTTPTNAKYDMIEHKVPSITHEGKEYRFVELANNSDAISGNVKVGDTTVVFVYKPVELVNSQVKGSVIVRHVGNDGTKLAEEEVSIRDGVVINRVTENFNGTSKVTDTPTNLTYDVTSNKRNEIKGVADKDWVYYKVKDTAPTGKVVEGTTYVTYVYTPVVTEVIPTVTKGSVEVKYYEEGTNTEIKEKVVNTPLSTISTSTLTRKYYLDDRGERVVLSEDTEVVDEVINYDTNTNKPGKIKFEGFDYDLVGLRPNTAKPVGEVVEGTTLVEYDYRVIPKVSTEYQNGTVIVRYEDTKGNTIQAEKVVKNGELVNTVVTTTTPKGSTVVETPSNATYDTTLVRNTYINNGGFVYTYKNQKGTEKESGVIPVGTTVITYVYDYTPQIVKEDTTGSVYVHYVDESYRPIKQTVTNTDKGVVTVTTTTITPQGSTTEVVPTEATYNTSTNKVNEVVFGGFTYEFSKLKDGDVESGKLKAGKTHVTYIYRVVPQVSSQENRGTVIVHYVDEAGNTIKSDSKVVENALVSTTTTTKLPTAPDSQVTTKTGITYDTVPLKHSTIDFENFEYKLLKLKSGDVESGLVPVGTTHVTYIYKVVPKVETSKDFGSVIVNYVNEDGETIKDSNNLVSNVLVSTTKVTELPKSEPTKVKVNTGKSYDSTEVKPLKIEKDGYTYVLSKLKEGDIERGLVKSGTTTVTYIYKVVPKESLKELKGTVIVNFVDELSNKIADSTTIKDNVVVEAIVTETTPKGSKDTVTVSGVSYNAGEVKKDSIIFGDYTYVFKELKPNDIESGLVPKGTREVTYIYSLVPKKETTEERGTVVARYFDTAGKELQTPKIIVENELVSTTVTTTTPKGSTPVKTETGKVYDSTEYGYGELTISGVRYIKVSVKGTEKAVIPVGRTYVDYIYAPILEKVDVVETKGSVVVDYKELGTDKVLKDRVVNVEDAIIYTKKTTTTYYTDLDGKVVVLDEKEEVSKPEVSYSTIKDKLLKLSKDGKNYVFADKVDGLEEGLVKEGTLVITYFYTEEVVEVPNTPPTTPTIPGIELVEEPTPEPKPEPKPEEPTPDPEPEYTTPVVQSSVLPKTGDSSTGLAIMGSALSLLALFGVLSTSRRKDEE